MEKKIILLKENFAICKLPNKKTISKLSNLSSFFSYTVTNEETSLVCLESDAPKEADVESGWRALKVAGPLDFSLTGIVSNISKTLADSKIPIFVISTYETDYILIKEADLQKAIKALSKDWKFIE